MQTITEQDIVLMINLIDTCAERGAFKGPEFTTVGSLREKLVLVIDQNKNTPPVETTETE